MNLRGGLRRARRAGLAVLLATGGLAMATATPAAAAPLVVQDLQGGLTPADLVTALVGDGVTVSNITYNGADIAAGTFSGGADVVGFDGGVLLSSGRVRTPDPGDVSCFGDKGVEGPNQCQNSSTDHNRPGDPDLTAASGVSTFDAAVLEFDFTPSFDNIQFRYVFSSEEYREFANSQFNDTFAFFVNGENCARVPGTGEPVSINTINNGDPGGDPTPHNAHLYRDNTNGAIATEMDGLTVVLTCSASVVPGQPSHMKLAIADGSDEVLDSNVFLEGGSFVSVADVTTVLTSGEQSGEHITVAPGSVVTDQAFIHGTNSSTADGTVTYTVHDNPECLGEGLHAGTTPVHAGVAEPSSPIIFVAEGVYYWVAHYSGDDDNEPASSPCGDETVTVERTQEPTDTTYTGDTSGFQDQPATLAGHLTDEDGDPLAGKTLTFTFDGAFACSDTTDASGNASCSYTPTQPRGTYPVTAAFAGDEQYLPSSDTASFSVIVPVMTGRAYAVSAKLPGIARQIVADTGPVATEDAITVRRSVLSLSRPSLAVSVAESKVETQPGSSTASSTIASVTVKASGVPVVKAWALTSRSTSSCAQAPTGSSSIAKLQIGTRTYDVSSNPNATIRVSGLTVKLNERLPFTTADGRGLTVNALHVTGSGIDVVVASATSDIHQCSAPKPQ
jgi:hypothetical protein